MLSPKSAASLFRFNVAVWIILGGLLWALAAYGFEAPARLAFDFLKYPIDGDPGPFDANHRFFSALGGAFLTSLGVLMYLLVAPAIERGDAEGKRAGLIAAFVWFVIDSGGSIASGAASNAAINVVLLGLLVLPIVLARNPAESH